MEESGSGIIDFSKVVNKRVKSKAKNPNEHSFKHPCAALICGHTGSGESNFLMNLLLKDDVKMHYDRIYLICPFIEEETYEFLKSYYDELQDAFEEKSKLKLGYRVFTHINKAEDIPEPSSFDKKLQNIVIVDDFMMNKAVNAKIENFITMSRKYNTSLIYLSQSFFQVPKNIRLQMGNGYVVLFHPPSLREIGQYMLEFGLGLTKEQFKDIFKRGTSVKYDPLVIDFRNRGNRWMFRRGLLIPLGVDPDLTDDASDPEEHLIKEL